MSNIAITTGLCATGIVCGPYNCADHGTCETVETYYAKGFNHDIHTDHSITVGGKTVHINKTDRVCSVSWQITRDDPVVTHGFYEEGYGIASLRCFSHEPAVYSCTFSDVGTLVYSTIFYIDHRYGVCLYRRETEKVACNVTSNEWAQFKEPYASPKYSQVQIKTKDYTSSRLSEWVLINNGVETILETETFTKDPFGGGNNGLSWREMGWVSNEESGVQYFPDYKPDPETRVILVFPQPPSLGIAISPEICRLGFYDYSNEPGEEPVLGRDDGGKDMFYPMWYRDPFFKDPMWEEARDRRWNAKWWHMPEEPERDWQPPPVRVDPLPVGSFVKHPKIGELYQWLLTIEGSADKPFVATSPDLNAKIDEQLKLAVDATGLSLGLKTHDTTLYYPIGVI